MSVCVVPYTEAQRIAILQHYGRTPESVKQDIEAVKVWLQKQPHLPKGTSDTVIERELLMSKFRVERAKERIDMYYTIRSLVPEFYETDSDAINKAIDSMYALSFPKLTKDYHRVFFTRLRDTDVENCDLNLLCAYICNVVVEIRMHEDYLISDIRIFDMTGISMAHARKMTPLLLRKCIAVFDKVGASGVKAIHIINCPPMLQTFYAMVKTLLKSKIAERLFIHEDMESLYKIVPREILPVDFGGEEKSLEELNELWRKKALEYLPRFEALRKLQVNEKLRPGKPITSDILGIHGNFRQLDVD